MKPGNFILDGNNSEDFGAFIQSRPVIETPRRKVDFKTSFGQSGTNPFDEEAYENTTMDLIMYVIGTEINTASDNRAKIHFLFDSGIYKDFIPYFDETKIYRIMTTAFPSFSPKYYHEEGQPFNIGLTVKPYKYYVDSGVAILSQPGIIHNPYLLESLPLIKIVGSGDVTLTVNGLPFVVKGVAGHVFLDSQLMLAYKDTDGLISSENNKVYTRNYPFLDVGSNVVSWTGTVTSVEITKRWRTLA